MPEHEEIAIWLGWKRGALITVPSYGEDFSHSYYDWHQPGGGITNNLPDWRGDPWRWVEIAAMVQSCHTDALAFRNTADAVICEGISWHRGYGADMRLAFWDAFDAWWETEKGE